MARMNGKSRFPIDASLILNQGTVAFTAPTNLPTQILAQTGAYWQQGAPDVRDGSIELVGQVQSLTGNLQVDLYVAADATLANPVLVESVPLIAMERFEIAIDETAWLNENPTATVWFATLNVSGAGASAQVFAYLAPHSPI